MCLTLCVSPVNVLASGCMKLLKPDSSHWNDKAFSHLISGDLKAPWLVGGEVAD